MKLLARASSNQAGKWFRPPTFSAELAQLGNPTDFDPLHDKAIALVIEAGTVRCDKLSCRELDTWLPGARDLIREIPAPQIPTADAAKQVISVESFQLLAKARCTGLQVGDGTGALPGVQEGNSWLV